MMRLVPLFLCGVLIFGVEHNQLQADEAVPRPVVPNMDIIEAPPAPVATDQEAQDSSDTKQKTPASSDPLDLPQDKKQTDHDTSSGGSDDKVPDQEAKPIVGELTRLAEDTDELPLCLQRVEYLTQHQDPVLAISYLRKVVMNGNLPPAHRSRAILVLSDNLEKEGRGGEALYWLKIWLGLYPARPEAGAVAHRVGTIYSNMHLPNLARDAFYQALSSTVNLAEVKDGKDLKFYTSLTQATLWSLAENEYQGGQWDRAAELYARYEAEGKAAPEISLEKASFRRADCAYQASKWDDAEALYEKALEKHPFNPLAPEARLHLYQVLIAKKNPERAGQELQALAWTVHTIWTVDEPYWQGRVSEVLLALNKDNVTVLKPLLKEISKTSSKIQDKHWQNVIDRYDKKCALLAVGSESDGESYPNLADDPQVQKVAQEQNLIEKMRIRIDQLLPKKAL